MAEQKKEQEKPEQLKPCFVIAPIGEPDSPVRKVSDQVLKYIIKPAARQCGYDAIRADEALKPGMITKDVIQRIIDDPLVIADLSGHNPNVFYELALRHALKKPLIQLITVGEKIPFDVVDMRTIRISTTDLEVAEQAKAQIVKQIECIEKDGFEIETPISMTLDVQSMKGSTNATERTLGQLVESVAIISQAVNRLQHPSDRSDSDTEVIHCMDCGSPISFSPALPDNVRLKALNEHGVVGPGGSWLCNKCRNSAVVHGELRPRARNRVITADDVKIGPFVVG